MSLAFTAAPTAQNPNFAGRWVAISPGYTGREVRITEARGTLKEFADHVIAKY